jgi:hypothetical protein
MGGGGEISFWLSHLGSSSSETNKSQEKITVLTVPGISLYFNDSSELKCVFWAKQSWHNCHCRLGSDCLEGSPKDNKVAPEMLSRWCTSWHCGWLVSKTVTLATRSQTVVYNRQVLYVKLFGETINLFSSFFFVAWTQGLHLEPLHQPFFVKGFFKIRVSGNYLPSLAWNCDPSDLCLLSS